MKILETGIMRGPSYWSVSRHRLIVMKVDIGDHANLPIGEIDGLFEKALKVLPTLATSRCSNGAEHFLCGPVTAETSLVELIGRIALELQCLAGMFTDFGCVVPTHARSQFRVIFEYPFESAGVLTAEYAVRLTEALLVDHRFPVKNLQKMLGELRRLYEDDAAGPSTQAIVDEAEKRRIPVTRLDENFLIMLGWGKYRKLFRSTVVGTTGSVAVDTVALKHVTKHLLEENGIPVPQGVVTDSKKAFWERIVELAFPLTVKPVDGNHGRGITTGVHTIEDALVAWEAARKVSDRVILEASIEGNDYRLLVINYRFTAAARRKPAMVTGDGVSTVGELIDRVNADPDRGPDHSRSLTVIGIDTQTLDLLKEQGLTLQSVAAEGQQVQLKRTANLSTGGTSVDVTDDIHPDNILMAERIARIFQLDVCGIDIVAGDLSRPLTHDNGAVIEVNAGPGFRMHMHPTEGKPRNVAEPVVDMLFPDGQTGRIPVVAVTGTNGKTTVVRLIAHLARQGGKSVGYTTTEGVYLGDRVIYKGDCSGPGSARMVLNDPLIDFAVLESARGGILRSGLAFDRCDIGIVTNVTEDHLGQDEIETIEEYARVKEVVPRSVSDDGYAVLNADDERVLDMRRRLTCNVVLFSMGPDNAAVSEHCAAGGAAVVVDSGNYVLRTGDDSIDVIPVNDVPLTFSGTAGFMVQNVLPAIAAAHFSGFDMETIREGLRTFAPSWEQTPGRMNLFDFGHFRMMLDYAHNAAAFEQIERYMQSVDATRKIAVIGGTGDRRDEDLRNLGRYAARIFDEIVIRHDRNTRGRTAGEIDALVTDGIRSVEREVPFRIISDEQEALEYAAGNAGPGDFVFVCADNVWESIRMIRELQQRPQEC